MAVKSSKNDDFRAAKPIFDRRVSQLREVTTETELHELMVSVGDEPFDWPHSMHLFWKLQTDCVLEHLKMMRVQYEEWIDAMDRDGTA